MIITRVLITTTINFCGFLDKNNNVFIIDESLCLKKIGIFPVTSIVMSGCFNPDMLWIQSNDKNDIKLYTMDKNGSISMSKLELNYSVEKGFSLKLGVKFN